MKRAVGAVLVLVAGAAAAWWAGDSRPARACSLGPVVPESIPQWIADSKVVAIGTLQDAEHEEITLVVEEGFKGAAPGDRLTLKNLTPNTTPICDLIYQDPGFHLPEGERVLVMLDQDDTDARFHPTSVGRAWFAVDEDGLYWWWARDRSPRLSDIEVAIRGFPPATEPPVAPACEVVADPLTSGLKATVEGSELIVLGEVSDGGARARIQVSEYLKGNGPEELVVNGEDNWIEPTGAGCVVRSGDAAAPLPIGKPGLFFLKRDEFGVGDWRPLVRSGVFLLSGERLNGLPGLPSVSEVRAEAERVTGQPSRRSAVAPDPTQPSGDEPARAGDPGDDALSGDSTGDWVVAAAALVLAFLLGAGVVMADLRLRARRRGGG